MLVVDTHQSVLVDYQDALAVADIQYGRCHGVMRCTIGIAAKSLQLPDAPCLQGIGYGSAHTGVVLVHVHAL